MYIFEETDYVPDRIYLSRNIRIEYIQGSYIICSPSQGFVHVFHCVMCIFEETDYVLDRMACKVWILDIF